MLKTLFCIAALSMPLTALAEADEQANPTAQHHLQQISEKLQLTEQQKLKIDKIFAEQHQKVLAIHAESHERVKAELNPVQAEKWEAMKKAHEERQAAKSSSPR